MATWADTPGCIEKVVTVVDGKTVTTEIPTFKCLEVVFSQILNVVLGLATLALFVMLVTGGFKFLTSGGDPKAAGAAKQTMTYAIIGIVLMVLAFLIFRLIETFTGVNVTKFEIPTSP